MIKADKEKGQEFLMRYFSQSDKGDRRCSSEYKRICSSKYVTWYNL